MSVVGEIALWMALLFAAWCVVAGVAGGRTSREPLLASARRSLVAAAGMLALALAGIVAPLADRDLSLAFVALQASTDLPARYAAASLWASGAGASLLLAALAAVALSAVSFGVSASRAMRGLRLGVCGAVLAWLAAPLCAANVFFARLEWIPPDGAGLPAELQSPFLLLQPPLLLVGLALATPLAAATVAALADRSGASAGRGARLLALAGLVIAFGACGLAARWAQLDPLWGERWMLRPLLDGSLAAVAGVALLLAATAGRRRAMRRLAPAAAIVSLALSLAIGTRGAGDVVRGESLLPSPAALALLGGSLVVALVAWRRARRVAVPPTRPLPSRASRLRRAGAVVAVGGFAVVALALRGANERVAREVELPTGVPVPIEGPGGEGWTAVGQGVSRYRAGNREIVQLGVELRPPSGTPLLLSAGRWQAVDRRDQPRGDAVGVVGVRPGVRRDVTLELRDARDGGALATIAFQPLASLYWLGGALVLVGLVLALRD